MQTKEKGLKELFFPIFLEMLFLTLVGSVDTLMLSVVNDSAVGGVGASNTYLGIFIISFSIISSGMMAVMTQYIGAGKPGAAKQACLLGGVLNGALGVVLSLVLIFFAAPILKFLGVAEALFPYAVKYTRIVGGSCILNALIPILNSYLRAFGFTKGPMIATAVSNIINAGLNALFLFVFDMEVVGVALATVIARTVNLLAVVVLALAVIKVPKNAEKVSKRTLLSSIIKIGFPSAMETALYNTAMTFVMKFLNQMDAEGFNVTAKTYASQITTFSYIAGIGISQANAIMTGWKVGQKRYDECLVETNKNAKLGVLTGIGFATLSALLCRPLMSLFTSDPEMIRVVQYIFIADIALEAGRVANLVYGNALKTCGDAPYTVTIAAIFMMLFAVGGTYFLGVKLGWLVVGSWIGLALDECARAILMRKRWQSRKWESKVLIK